MTGLLVEHSTPLVQLQDAGRFGCRHIGVTQGGALDWISMSWANALLGNPLDTAVIEVTFGGLSLRVQQDAWLAIAGADLAASLDGKAVQPWQAFQVRPQQLLEFHRPVSGVRAYLAAPGGFDSPVCLGSRSTVTRDGLGGLDGKGSALVAGSRLSFQGQLATPVRITTQAPPDISPEVPMQVVLGAQIAGFSGQSLFDFFNHPWHVDVRADRMGMRLLGSQLRYLGEGLISEGIPLGAIQVPPDGQPIILLNDRQTIGGYPRLGALTPASIARLAQAQPGDRIRFVPTLQETAQVEHLALFDRLERLSRESAYSSADWAWST
jgi:biotin-dependent carboxylase-like uncharacterized protein